MNWRMISIVLAMMAASCGSPKGKSNATSNSANNNPNSSSNSSNGVVGDDIGVRLWATICDAAFNCESINPQFVLVAGRFSSEADCVANGTFPGLDLDYSQLNASVEAGRVRYDDAKADECFAAVQNELCRGGGFENVPACDEVVKGLIGEDQPCVSDECAEGLDCTEGEEECSGTCQPNCGDEQCTDSQICDLASETCKDPGSAGDPCDWDGDCSASLFCDDGTCSAGGTVADGGACSDRRECEGDLICAQNRCSSIQFAGLGEACSFGEEITTVCAPGTVCTDLEVDGMVLVGTCGAPKLQGAECRITFECAWGLYCTAENPLSIGACETTLVAGAACSDDAQCRSYNCSDSVCDAGDTDETVCTF